MLGARVVALDLEGGLAVAGDAVEEDRLLDRRHERVADAAEHRVVGQIVRSNFPPSASRRV